MKIKKKFNLSYWLRKIYTSKFYFKRKHYGYLNALISCFPKFLSSILKFLFYMILIKQYKREIYFNRALGFLNALLGRKSTYRPKLD